MDTRSPSTLHAAIKAQDIEQINAYLASMSDLELRKVLQERVDGLTAIELAFGINKDMSLNIAKSILSTAQKFKLKINQVARTHPVFPLWSQIFMTFKYYFMTLKNGRRISSKELATKMAFAKPFIHEVNILDVMDREGFIRTALLLGAPCDPQRLCSKIILANMDLSKAQKEKLVDWLLVNNFLNKEIQPLPLEDYGRWIKKGYYEHVHVFMSKFPNWINTSDGSYSVLTKIVPKMEMLLRYMNDIKKQFGVRKLIELLTQKMPYFSTKRNHRDNIVCYNFHAHFFDSGIRWPIEIVTAMLESHTDDLVVAEHLLHRFKSIDMVLYHTFPQYREKLELRANGKQHALTIESSENSNKGNSLGSAASDFFPIDQFPSDLIYVIGGLLKPMDLLSVFIVNKRMASFLRSSKNEIFWQSYYDTHFQRDFGPKMISYKTKMICNAKSLYNWTRNQSFQLELDQTTPIEIDENWLLVNNNNDNKHSVLWSCHTHKKFYINKEADEIPAAFMKNYTAEALPAVISWNKIESSYCLQRNDEHFVFKSLVGQKRDYVIPAGNRLLLDGLVCDVETDQVLSGPNPPKNIGFFPTYNPYSNNFTLAGRRTIELCDMNGGVVQTFNLQGHYFSAFHRAVMANEYEICFVEGPLRFDLRTGRMLPQVWYRHATLSPVAFSPHRMLYRDQQLDIVVSWHLPSSRWEFAAQMEPVPQCVNSRYIAAKHHNKTVVYDYCI